MLDFVANDGFSYLWELKLMFELPYSLQQINEILKKMVWTHTARQKTLITEAAKARRVRFAEDHLAANTDWSQVMFSNEKIVQNYANNSVKVRRFRGTAWQQNNIVRTNRRRGIKVKCISVNIIVFIYFIVHQCLWSFVFDHFCHSKISQIFFLLRSIFGASFHRKFVA